MKSNSFAFTVEVNVLQQLSNCKFVYSNI